MGDVDVASPAIPTHVSIDYSLAHSRSAPVGALSGVTANFTAVGCMCLSMLCVCVVTTTVEQMAFLHTNWLS